MYLYVSDLLIQNLAKPDDVILERSLMGQLSINMSDTESIKEKYVKFEKYLFILLKLTATEKPRHFMKQTVGKNSKVVRYVLPDLRLQSPIAGRRSTKRNHRGESYIESW